MFVTEANICYLIYISEFNLTHNGADLPFTFIEK